MVSQAAIRAEALRLRDRFAAQGATAFEAPILLPAETLLDLYGEDIRARAYVTMDPLRGEQMLRPDFTVPVAEAHMAGGAGTGAAARYTYAGEVFRRQEEDPERPSEFFQAGLELFDGEAPEHPEQADADVFAALAGALAGLPLRMVIGDTGVLMAAVEGLTASETRKAALRRHLWRPQRFRALLERFAGLRPVPEARAALLAQLAAGQDPVAAAGPQIGSRSAAEVRARLARLEAEAAEPAIPGDEVALLDQVLELKGPASEALAALTALSAEMGALAPAAARLEARLEALAARGIDLAALEFEASFGRTTLEYYDGFVFGLLAADHPDWAPLASGGRYDALTRALGGRDCPAVGGVIRPELVLKLRGEAAC